MEDKELLNTATYATTYSTPLRHEDIYYRLPKVKKIPWYLTPFAFLLSPLAWIFIFANSFLIVSLVLLVRIFQ